MAVSIVDFGAVGDGVHDDAPALRAALAAAAKDDGVVIFPSGPVRISSDFRDDGPRVQ